jgi:hypothetical protein
MKYLLLFLCNEGYVNEPHVKFTRTLPVCVYCVVYNDVTVRCVYEREAKLLAGCYVTQYPFLPSTAAGHEAGDFFCTARTFFYIKLCCLHAQLSLAGSSSEVWPSTNCTDLSNFKHEPGYGFSCLYNSGFSNCAVHLHQNLLPL